MKSSATVTPMNRRVRIAAVLGLAAVAVTDRNTLAGVVRAHIAAKQAGIRLVVGARLDLEDGPSLLCFPTDRAAYGRLSRLLTVGRRRAPKGDCQLRLADVFDHGDGQIVVALPPVKPDPAFAETLLMLRDHFRNNIYLAASHLYCGDDTRQPRDTSPQFQLPADRDAARAAGALVD